MLTEDLNPLLEDGFDQYQDLSELDDYVPYSGATNDLDMGHNKIIVDTIDPGSELSVLKNLKVPSDTYKLILGNTNPLHIYSTAVQSFIQAQSGNLILGAAGGQIGFSDEDLVTLGKMEVGGSVNQVQFTIASAATQGTNVFEILKSAGGVGIYVPKGANTLYAESLVGTTNVTSPTFRNSGNINIDGNSLLLNTVVDIINGASLRSASLRVNGVEIVGIDSEVNASVIEDKFVRNDADDVIAGILTANGVKMDDGESIEWGGDETLSYNNDRFEFSGDTYHTSGQLLVDGDANAFAYRSNTNYNLYFDQSNLRFSFRRPTTGEIWWTGVGAGNLGKMFVYGEAEIDGDLNHDGGNVGFYGTVPTSQQTITGSTGGNVALQNLLTALANLGLIIDNTT